jgi:hypothetical protein
MAKQITTHFAHGTWSLCNHGSAPIVCSEVETEVTCKTCLKYLTKREGAK